MEISGSQEVGMMEEEEEEEEDVFADLTEH